MARGRTMPPHVAEAYENDYPEFLRMAARGRDTIARKRAERKQDDEFYRSVSHHSLLVKIEEGELFRWHQSGEDVLPADIPCESPFAYFIEGIAEVIRRIDASNNPKGGFKPRQLSRRKRYRTDPRGQFLLPYLGRKRPKRKRAT